MNHALDADPIVRDSVAIVGELGNLFTKGAFFVESNSKGENLQIAKSILSPLEEANKTLQTRSCSVSDIFVIVNIVKNKINTIRTKEEEQMHLKLFYVRTTDNCS